MAVSAVGDRVEASLSLGSGFTHGPKKYGKGEGWFEISGCEENDGDAGFFPPNLRGRSR
jgi:hypothetical protein